MKQYKDYSVDDFLLDDDFLEWVRAGCPSKGSVWSDFLLAYPEKRDDLDEARAFLDYQRSGISLPTLSDQEVNQHIDTVLARTQPDEVPIRRLNPYAMWWRVAAAILLLSGIGWSISNWQSTQSPFAYERIVKTSTTPLSEIVNTNQASKSITLPDGSHITLAKNARISYSTQMASEPARNVYLDGEAFFEVTKDPAHPFFVYADGLVTRVVGTSFTIRTSGKQVSVVVRSGRVAVYPMKEVATAQKAEEKLMLIPNQQATFVAEENQLTRAIASQPVTLSTDSQTASLQFDNAPIADVFTTLEHTYGIPIQYDAATMKNCFLTSTLADEPFYSKLAIICQAIGASYKVQDTHIVITSAGCD